MASGSSSRSPSLRALLPDPLKDSRNVTPASSGAPIVPYVGKKRPAIAAACGACRKRKVRCSGDRPKCSRCVARDIVCEYDTAANETKASAVKRKYEELKTDSLGYQRVFDALRSRSESDAQTILQRIRGSEDIDHVVRQIEGGDLLLQAVLVPETRYRFDFPLSSKLPPYLVQPSNPYLNSLIYEWTSPLVTSSIADSEKQPSVRSVEVDTPYLRPYFAAEIVDVQLSIVEPSKWTTVCADNVLMRRLLHAFFLQDHDWWTAFQKDYFLEDMAKMRSRFCSSLLVNAVLALSCNYHRDLPDRAAFWNPRNLGYRFLAEAKRLWEYESDKNTLTTIHAGLLLHVVMSGSGADKIGWAYSSQSYTIAHNMALFKRSTTIKGSKMRDARDYTAWALFFWQSLMCFHYFRTPPFQQPPEGDLPSPSKQPRWYGEFWLKYPLNRTLYPCGLGDLFKAKAEFAIIQNDMAQRLFAGPSGQQDLSAVEVANFYSRCKSWYDNLPESLSPRKAILPSQLKLHMHYFQVLLRLLQAPSVLTEPGSELDASLTARFGESPRQLVAHSKVCLETLLRAYYLRHGFEWLDSFLIALLAEICFVAISNIYASPAGSGEDLAALQSTVVLLAKGLYEQGQSFFLGTLVFELVKDKMRPADLVALQRFVRLEPVSEAQAAGLRQTQMEWPVQVASMADDPESKRLGDLVKHFRAASLETSSEEGG